MNRRVIARLAVPSGLLLLLAGLAWPLAALQEIRLAPAFRGAPLLQRDVALPVWGTAEPGQTVTVRFAGQVLSAAVDDQGAWKVLLKPLGAQAEPRELSVGYGADDPDPLVRRDVVVGDIWIAAGQSNMELGMGAIDNRSEELKDGTYPAIRLFLVPKASTPYDNAPLSGAWFPASRANLTAGGWNGFSAVGFTFARKLFQETKVPIGIIQTAYGGSPIESWISPRELAAVPELGSWNARLVATEAAWAQAKASDPSAKHPWETISDSSRLEGAQIWKAMVAPLAPLPVKGVIWYQGETNVGNGPAYTAKMAALIHSYRTTLANPALPFYFVQLPPWNYGGGLPSMWAAQEAALAIPGTGMAVTVDVGDVENIHPPQKRPVGERLALLALKHSYDRKDLLADSPAVSAVLAQAGTLELHFRDAGAGLDTTDKQAPKGFRISADGHSWLDAEAVIKGDTVILRHPELKTPRYARYAWTDVPLVNLINSAGLPVRPWGGNL